MKPDFMKNSFLISLFLILSGSLTVAQPPETTYLGNVVYEGYYDDRSWGPFNIGFNFNFYGNNYSQFYVTSNGLVMFGSGSNDYTEDPIPSGSSPNNYIAAFWDDIVIDPSGKILYTTIGAAPNRKCVIQWTNMGFYASPVLMGTFSVILYEGSNNVQIQYRSIIDNTSARAHGSSATIGLENASGSAGVQYAYHVSTAAESEQAILFSRSGSTYTVNSSATYDGVYLTKNMTLPEPGIPGLVSPAQNAVIGSTQTFQWTAASNASNYLLKISANSDISSSTDYSAGANTSYEITGLNMNSTYYWAVFASNSTGTTWSEINRFTTSANPPLAGVPQTVWMEQNEERTIRMQYTGGDAGAKTAFVTSLPAEGSLYQYNSGLPGAEITTVPAQITDPGLNVIYIADGGTGNGAGNFNFYIHDNTGDSPASTITVNINPPGVPNFILAARSGNIEIQFDKPMTDPTGKESQFIVKVNGSPVTISSVSLKPGDPYSIVITLAVPLTGSETVLISYTQGDVTSEAGGLLPSFVDQPVSFLIQTISFPELPVMTYGDAPVTLSATASSGLPVSYTSSNTTVGLISGATLTANSTGTSLIMAQQVGNGTYAPARYIRTLTVNKASQNITFPALPSKTFGDADFSPGATSSSGLAVAYSSDNPSVAVVTGTNIHITGAGTAVITASQDGNNLYNPANNVTSVLTVSKADQTITFSPLTAKLVSDADFNPGATASSGLAVTYTSSNPSVATITGNLVHPVSAGTAFITASQEGNENYNAAAQVSQLLTVNKGSQTITFNALPEVTYGDPDIDPAATSSSSLPVTYLSSDPSVAVISGNVIHITGAGTTVISATQEGNEDFDAAPVVQQQLTVRKADQMITFNAIPDHVYGDDAVILTATASSGLSVVYSSSNPLVATVTDNILYITGAGNAVITASQPGNNNYNAAPQAAQGLVVLKASQVISFPTLPQATYGGADLIPAATSTSGLPVTYSSSNASVAVISGETIVITGAGTALITASQAGNDNYESAVDEQQTLIVAKAGQTIIFGALSPVAFGAPDFSPAAVSTSGLTISYSSSNPEVAVITGNMIHVTGAGSTVITATQPGNVNYNAADEVQQTLDVIKADQTITFNALPEYVFGDSPFNPGAVSSSGLNVIYSSSNPSVAIIDGNLIQITGAGTVVITAMQPGNTNYNEAVSQTQTLVVRKAPQTITFGQPEPHTYGDQDFNPGATASSGLDVVYLSSNNSIVTVSGSFLQITGAGTVEITAIQEGDENYEAAESVSRILIVNKADQTIAFSTIAPVVYGNMPFSPGATASSGLPVTYSSGNEEIVQIADRMIILRGAGTVDITASQPGDGNFNPADNVTVTLMVTKAQLSVTAEDKTRTYLTQNPELTISFSGFVYDDDQSVLDVLPAASTDAIAESPVGEYDINIIAGEDDNYDLVYIPGVLTITRIPQTISFTLYPESILVNETFELGATSSSGLAVSFESADRGIAEVTGTTLKGVSRGNTVIRAYQPGDDNYMEAEATITVEVISTHRNIMYLFTPNNDGFNDLWEIPELESYGRCSVRVYNRWGKLVFSSPDYHNEWDGTSDGVNLPPAAYYFIIKTEKPETITGTVNIVR